MSEQSISDKSQIIRNETQQHANTRGRVADVIDDINATKANKTDVTDVEGDISTHLSDFNNPHQVTKSQVGLGNADNTADLDKPISNAVQAELDDIRTDIEGQTDWNVAQDSRLDQLEQHNIEQDTALAGKANTDASNISPENSELWRRKLNVPQIPDLVISKGAVTADSSTAYLDLPISGKNKVLIDGQDYERTDAQSFPFTPVTTDQKILIIYAKPDAQVFHLVQGAESTEAVEPAYSGLFVARLLVTTEGIDIVEATSGFREKAVDNFAIYSLLAGDRVIGVGANMRLKVQSSGAVKIGGFYNEEDKIYNGCPISVRNDTPFPMEFYNAVDASREFIAINSADLPFSIKPGETANFAYRGGGIAEIVKTGGGASKASEVENDSTVTGASVKDALESLGGEKLDKPTADGSWVITKSGSTITYTDASTFGQNIANTNLTWSADRTQNLNGNKLIFTGGRFSVPALELEITSENSVPNKIWTDGVGYYFNNNLGIKKRVAIGSVFIYTPTGNFTLSQVKVALEATGMIFNDAHIIVNVGSNNYTCSIDIGATNPNDIITIGKRGSGSIAFNSTRTLNSGVDAITIMNGNEGSMLKLEFGTTTDFLTIRNL